MKIIKNGLMAKDGIHRECPRCNCEYLIEDKKDFLLHIVYDPFFIESRTGMYKVEYNSCCPECGRCDYFGAEEYVRHPIFDREDWKERYSVSVEEARELGAE